MKVKSYIVFLLIICFYTSQPIFSYPKDKKYETNNSQMTTAQPKEYPLLLKKDCLSIEERKKLHLYYSEYYENKSKKNLIYLYWGILAYFFILTGFLVYAFRKKISQKGIS